VTKKRENKKNEVQPDGVAGVMRIRNSGRGGIEFPLGAAQGGAAGKKKKTNFSHKTHKNGKWREIKIIASSGQRKKKKKEKGGARRREPRTAQALNRRGLNYWPDLSYHRAK